MTKNVRSGLKLIVAFLLAPMIVSCGNGANEAAATSNAPVQAAAAAKSPDPSAVELYRWSDMPEEMLNPELSRKFITGERLMVAHITLKKGTVVPTHSHDNEQFTYILKGALKFEIEGKEFIVREGEVLTVPPNVPHAATALEDTLDMDVFSPPRQDWINKTDSYLRGK